MTLAEQFGPIDIYLFDQLLKGRVKPGMTVVEAGCAHGRNLVYLLREGYEVYGADQDRGAIAAARRMAAGLVPGFPADNFRVEPVEAMSFPDAAADLVICIAVLHFARDDAHFRAMLDGAWRVLKPGGHFLCRVASDIGMETRVRRLDGRRAGLPDGSERYLVDEPLLAAEERRIRGVRVDPLKSTIVHDQRCMSTWVLRKEA